MEVFQVKPNVDRITLGNKVIHLVGTAHVSAKSEELAEEVIREIKPDTVAVELCDARYQSLLDPQRWRNMDIVQVIRSGKAYVLMAQLMLAAFQKKLGNQLQIKPGAEMMKAISVANDINASIALVDRDVKITLKRTWASVGFFTTIKLLFAMVAGIFTTKTITAEEIEKLKSTDALAALMEEFSVALPGVRTALIDERDQYIAAKIRSISGDSIVAVIGAGHIPGIKHWLNHEVNIEELETMPAKGALKKILVWLIPALFLASILYGCQSSGTHTSMSMVAAWFWIHVVCAGLGAALIFAHPLTVLSAALASPFTSLTPFIRSGWVAGLVEATLRKPRVSDLESITDDIASMKGLWKNRVSRILLIVASTNLFGTIGTVLSLSKIASML